MKRAPLTWGIGLCERDSNRASPSVGYGRPTTMVFCLAKLSRDMGSGMYSPKIMFLHYIRTSLAV